MPELADELEKYLAPEEDTPEATTEAPEDPEPETPAEETPEAPDDDIAIEIDGPEDIVLEAPETGETEPEIDPDMQAFLDKYQGDREKALKGAIEERKMFARQQEELGELRRMRELMEERLPEQDTEPEFQFGQREVEWFDEQIDTNPQAAAIWALQNDATGTLYDRAMDAWSEMPGQTRKAAQFERAIEQARLKEELVAETQPLKEQAGKLDAQSAWQEATRQVPDLRTEADAILAKAKENPKLLLGAETVEEKTKALVMLYHLVKGEQATSVEAVTAETKAEQAQAARAAKLSGSGPSQTTTRTPDDSIDPGEAWLEETGFNKFLTPEEDL